MSETNYRLRYLPLFYEDLDDENPKAANDLVDKVEAAILERQPIAESFEPYNSVRERKYRYYRIYVNNYTIFYVVIDDDPDDLIMEVRRFLYSGRNLKDLV